MAVVIVGGVIVGFAFFLGVMIYVVITMVNFGKWKRDHGWHHTWNRSDRG